MLEMAMDYYRSLPTGDELRTQYPDLENHYHFVKKALDMGKLSLIDMSQFISYYNDRK